MWSWDLTCPPPWREAWWTAARGIHPSSASLALCFCHCICFPVNTTLAACYFLPAEKRSASTEVQNQGFLTLISRPIAPNLRCVFQCLLRLLVRVQLSAVLFDRTALEASTEVITLTYFSYLIGILMGPIAGKLSNRMGNGTVMALGQ